MALPTTNTALSMDQFKAVLPATVKPSVNQALLDEVNALIADPELKHNFRDNIIGFTSVMQEGKFKITDYINAVKYVSFKLLGSSNLDAYMKTFPDRYADYMMRNVSSKDIASYVSSYNKNKLVNLVFAQTLVPVHVLNADMYQKALNTQAELMMYAKSEKVRSDAANSVMTQLRPPETKKMEIDVTQKQDGSIQELQKATLALARQQREMLESGFSNAKEVAHSEVIVKKVEE